MNSIKGIDIGKNTNPRENTGNSKFILCMIVFIPKFLVYVTVLVIWFYVVPWVDFNTVWAHLDTAAMFAYNIIRIIILKLRYYIYRSRSK
jgi:hypothetical protein